MGVAAVLALGVAVTLGTGGRGQALVQGTRGAIDSQFGTAGFRLAAIHLQGVSDAARPDILAAAGVYKDQPLLGLNLEEVRARIAKVGWVKSVRIVRLLPDTLVIAVEERRLVAVWERGGQTSVIDAAGQPVPEADPGRFNQLPLIVGAGANESAAAILPEIAARPRLAQRLEALVRVDQRRWDLRLKDGAVIQLPAVDEAAALIRLDQLDRSSRVLELGLARIDLRDPEVVAVRPREVPAAQPDITTPTGA